MRNSVPIQEDDDDGPIWEPVKLTPYDRRRIELRELEAKRDAILAHGEISDDARSRLAKLAPLITKAQERFDREGVRAKDDLWRKRRGIDDYRADAGREEYNTKRRKTRQHPNADLSDLTPEQKAQYERDRRSDANWFKRQREKGVSEPAITAAYAQRLEARRQERSAADELRRHPNYGLMGGM